MIASVGPYYDVFDYPSPRFVPGYSRDPVAIRIDFWEWITRIGPRQTRVPRLTRKPCRSCKEADYG